MNKVLFPHISWFLLLLIPVTFLGFYPSYFSKLFATTALFHVHAFFMMAWIFMAIVQPYLIHKKKTKLHKLIGRLSYVIMPVVFITTYLVLRHVYYDRLARQEDLVAIGKLQATVGEIEAKVAASMSVAVVYFLWLIAFYTMAIINRKKFLYHATYMLAAILTILGPTAERLIYNFTKWASLPYTFFAENAVIFFIMLLLAALAIYQYRKGNSVKPSLIVLTICIAGYLILQFFTDTRPWQMFVALIL